MNLDFLKKIEWTPLNILKAAATLLVALFLISIVWSLVAKPVQYAMRGVGNVVAPQGMSMPISEPGYYADEDYARYEEMEMMASDGYGEGGGATLSVRNVASMPSPIPPRGGTVGGNAEDFEVTDYSVSIETRDRDGTCSEVADLKALEYVVFESANEYERGCNYTFKVEHERVEEVLAVLEALDPKDLSENTYTIKRQLDDFTSEAEILQSKLESIDETLENALDAYDEITRLATNTQDATALAKIFDSKINIIERLTQERINVAAQLERLERGRAEQLDKLEYTYFYVGIYENKFIDGERLADSWKQALRGTVNEINFIFQEVTLGLLALVFLIGQWLLYAFILLVVVKYSWSTAKYIWKK